MARPQRAHSGSNCGIHLTTIEQHCIPGRGAVYHGRPCRLLPNPCYARWNPRPDPSRRRILQIGPVSQRRSPEITGSPLYHISTKGNAHVRTLLAHKLRMHCSVTQTMA